MTVYTDVNFKTKKALKEAVASVESRGVTVYELSPFGTRTPEDGRVLISGPHFPQPHKWYARAEVVKGVIQPGSVR